MNRLAEQNPSALTGTHLTKPSNYQTTWRQSSCWEARSRSVSQEIRLLSWKLKIYCRAHMRPLKVPILSQMNPLHTLIPYLRYNIILPSTPTSLPF